MSSVKALILAGGQGTRFWPISRTERPKQFLSISPSGETLIQATARRVAPLVGEKNLCVITNVLHAPKISALIPGIQIISEPIGRNTAASIGLAAMMLNKEDPNAVQLVLPADHAVADEVKFRESVQSAIDLAAKKELLVTLGIAPTFPHTGYGYIQRGKKLNGTGGYTVTRFFEKPNLERATQYVEAGTYYWNSGMFAWRAGVILKAFKEFLPALYEGLQTISDGMDKGRGQAAIDEIFPSLESISIDFGVLEHARNCAVVPASFDWNDVGSWDAWAEHFDKDESGNLLHGDTLAIDSEHCIIHSEKRLTAVVGAKDLVVIDAGDALLVCPRKKVQDVRKVVEELKKLGRNDLI